MASRIKGSTNQSQHSTSGRGRMLFHTVWGGTPSVLLSFIYSASPSP